jgi:hypothetical protein
VPTRAIIHPHRVAGARSRDVDARLTIGVHQDFAYDASIRTRFTRLEAPLLIETADLGQPNRWDTNAINSSLALPSVGADRS